MAGKVYLGRQGNPPPPPPPAVGNWPGLTSMTWESQDGDAWDLLDISSGVVVTADGMSGLSMPPVDRFITEAAGVPGSLWRGMRVKEREVFWPTFVVSSLGSAEWLAADRKFWSGLQPDKVGKWSVVDATGDQRDLYLRFKDDGGHRTLHDPSLSGWDVYGLTFVAEEPFWSSSDPITRTWTQGAGAGDFFNSGHAPPFHISSSATIATAAMPNPGDVEAWPVWTIYGPTTSVTVGLNGRLVQVPFAVAAGHAVVIDTDPRQQTAWDATVTTVNGVKVVTQTSTELTGSLGATDFAAIPPGVLVTLSLSMVGSGSVQVDLVPLYYRAW